MNFLRGYRGRFLQCDGYEAYDQLTTIQRNEGPWTLVHCWSHLRRRFVKLARNQKSPIAEAAVRQIATLYAVEATVRGMAPEVRLAARRDHAAPIAAALKTWFEKQLSMIPSGSQLATDIRYGLTHWTGLTRFLDDGRLEMDTNPVENAIRPVAITRSFCPCRAGVGSPLPMASVFWLQGLHSPRRGAGDWPVPESPGSDRCCCFNSGLDARSSGLRGNDHGCAACGSGGAHRVGPAVD